MYFSGEYRQVGCVDVDALRSCVRVLPEAAWYEDTARQQVYAPHRATQNIALLFDPDMRHTDPTEQPALDRFAGVLQPVQDAIVAFYDDLPETAGKGGYFVRILLVRLDAGARIGSHRDHGASLARAHRVHCPIVTNPGTEFGIAGNIRHLPAGELWEINNRKVHGVRNLGDEARVHLIFDYVVPGEIVPDPDGELVA